MIPSVIFKPINCVASLPIRNWNWILTKQHQKPPWVASLPIRNWNSCNSMHKDQKEKSCEPTYKELKLEDEIELTGSSYCCEPTYKELKHFLNHKISKHFLCVASLPIRNWNQSPDHNGHNKHKVASLPIRNWNNSSYAERSLPRSVASLPIRNWNTVSEVLEFLTK